MMIYAPHQDVQRAIHALHTIPADCERDTWVRVGMACKDVGVSFDTFDQWSAQGDSYNAKDCLSAWKSFKEGKGVGAGTLFSIAKRHGWSEGHKPPAPPKRQSTTTAPKVTDTPQHQTLSDWGMRLWQSTQAIAPNDSAGQYLSARRCALPPLESHLRWHPSLKHPSGHSGPALVALLTEAKTAQAKSLHFTWVCANGKKADVKPPRRLLANHIKSGTVCRLWPDEYVTHGLAVAEGIETALSLAHGYTPVWSAIDAGNLAELPYLHGIECLLIARDRDHAGEHAARKCAARWVACGATVRLTVQAQNDVNDFLAEGV